MMLRYDIDMTRTYPGYTAGTWILRLKSKVSNTIQDDMLLIFKYP